MGRAELSRYSPEALAALANWGLVKRAQRELESGLAPQLEEQADALCFCFPDGVRTQFLLSRPPQEAQCSCGASGWCRHRVASLLWLSSQAATCEGKQVPQFDLGKLQGWLGQRLWHKAQQIKSQGLSAELVGPPWKVQLPHCDVLLLLPDDIYSMRCSCSQPSPCEHLALAGWVVAELQGCVGRADWQPQQSLAGRPDILEQFLDELLQEGCRHALTTWKVWGKKARQACQGLTWLQILLDRLEQLHQDYLEGSALYQPGEWLFCLLSFKARLRSDALSRGVDLPLEQELSHIRLLSLGCRLRSRRLVQYWLEPGGRGLSQEQALRPGISPRDAGWSGLGSVAQVAGSQLVSRGAVRRANRSLRMRKDRSLHSLTPLAQGWVDLSWSGLEDEFQRRERLPGRLLRPLVEADEGVVIPIAQVLSLSYAPGPQEVRAWLQEPQGGQWLLLRAHETGCAGALNSLVKHLPQATHVSGLLSWQQGLATMEPLALLTGEGLRVLDLEESDSGWELPLELDQLQSDPLQGVLQQALDLCQESAHLGLSQLMPSFTQRRQDVCQQLADLGMTHMAEAMQGDWDTSRFWPAAWRCFRASELFQGSNTWLRS
mgnify:CR=1 FL=1